MSTNYFKSTISTFALVGALSNFTPSEAMEVTKEELLEATNTPRLAASHKSLPTASVQTIDEEDDDEEEKDKSKNINLVECMGSFYILPNETVLRILSFVNIPELRTLVLVSKPLSALSKDNSLWQEICRAKWPQETGPDLTSEVESWKKLYRGMTQLVKMIASTPKQDGYLNEIKIDVLPSQYFDALSHKIDSIDVTCGLRAISPAIEKCAKFKKFSRLELLHNRLTTISSSICLLTNLETLYLNNNCLTSLNPHISRLSKLKILALGSNNLQTLPPEIGMLNHLEDLNLSNNPLQTLPPEIGKLSRLSTLLLEDCSPLQSMPPQLGQMTSLTHLSADAQLPAEVEMLKELKTLRLGGGVPVPAQIGQLTSLREFSLDAPLPPEIGLLRDLKILKLSGPSINFLPPKIGGLSGLRRLVIKGTQLTFLPEEIRGLNSLTDLDLEDNNLNCLPSSIGELNNLGSIRLGNHTMTEFSFNKGELTSRVITALKNRLTSVPAEMGKLSNLQSLYLGENQLQELPDSFENLENLETLDLSQNQFSEFPQVILKMSGLRTLCLNHNYLTSFPFEIKNLTELEKVFFGGNSFQIETLPKTLGNLKLHMDEHEEWISYRRPIYDSDEESSADENLSRDD